MPSDPAEKFTECRKAAEAGDLDAQAELGLIYFEGVGIPKDDAKGLEWTEKAAQQGSEFAEFNLGQLYRAGRGVTQDYSKAAEWTQKAAEKGHIDAQFNLGQFLRQGLGVTKNEEQAVKWFLLAAEQGLADAQLILGVMYVNGQGTNKDFSKALEYTLQAAKQGHVQAQCNLGGFYRDGLGVNQDYSASFEWTQKAAMRGHPVAQNDLGTMYCNGHGVSKDIIEAYIWYAKALNSGEATAQQNLQNVSNEMTDTEIDKARIRARVVDGIITVKQEAVRKRGWGLSVLLLVNISVAIIASVSVLLGIEPLSAMLQKLPFWISIAICLGAAAQAVCFIGVWQWKKWGLFGSYAILWLLIIMSLVLGQLPKASLAILVLLWALTKDKKELFTTEASAIEFPSDASIDDIVFDTDGYTEELAEEATKTWKSPEGDSVNLSFEDGQLFQVLRAKSMSDLFSVFSNLISKNRVGVVEIEACDFSGHKALRYIFRRPQQNLGITYIGEILIPFESFFYRFRIECPEVGVTGMRVAKAASDAMRAGILKIDSEITAFELPDGYSPNDPKFDAEFPGHPLSRLRRVMAHLSKSVKLKEQAGKHNPYRWPPGN